ncbi:MAG: aminopeptidase P family protein [Candidatus Thorarchaeota archaeon]|nr:MAG: aminopeptidase P family protein [Candidatus Thorarchaeota archaeon]
MTTTRLTPEHHQKRIEKLSAKLEEEEKDTLLVFNAKNIFYLTGLSFIPTERPIVLIVHKGETYFFVPSLEIDHVEHQVPFVSEIFSYFEYPDVKHPMYCLADVLMNEIKIEPLKVASEAPGAPSYWGYKGPKLEESTGFKFHLLPDLIMDMRVIKEPKEIDLMRESSKWADRVHKYLQDFTEVGANEMDVSIRASTQGSHDMITELGDNYHPTGFSMFPASAVYRGQIGPNSYFPHALSRGLLFKKGDTLVTGASSDVYGVKSELERTMFMGEPSSRQKELFKAMMAAQDAALAAAGPDIDCAEVDKAARKAFKDHGVANLVRHHTGHALGMEGHERPFLDVGSEEVLKPGMIFSCEPGIYERGLGGFRHSDTFVVTNDGIEVLTKYPRDLELLIIS